MAEHPHPTHRPVDALGVILALVFLAIASVGLTGAPWWLLDAGAKWIIAGVIALIGLALVLGALPGRRRP